MRYDGGRALELLRVGSGIPGARWRPGQEEAIRHMVSGDGPLLVVERTGWGKSFVYFIATKLLREEGRGLTLLVSPLLSLMRNQIAAAERMGIRAERITSDNKEDWPEVEERLARDEVDILLIAPERLANEQFVNGVLSDIAGRVAVLVVDEAHCISDWGHDFRPDYQLIGRLARVPRRLLATTATANNRVMGDLRKILGPSLTVQRGALARTSLSLQTMRLPSQAERLAWLASTLPQLEGCGIIYALTIRDAEVAAAWLKSQGLRVAAYTGRMPAEDRVVLEEALLGNKVKALVATTALGMGFDKPDLSFVIHYQTPGSVVHYYQQVGRAGRALEAARGVLMSGAEETAITDWFTSSAFPSRDEVEEVLAALEESSEGLSISELRSRVNMSGGRIIQTAKLLSLESSAPLVKEGAKWRLTAATLDKSFWERVERLTRLRQEEQSEMQEYVALQSGHMRFLVRALDGDPEAYEPPDLPPLSTSVPPDLVSEAYAFLRRQDVPVEPRKRWPADGRRQSSKTIPREHRACEGRALCTWNDAGWGELVRQGKHGERFDDVLVDACFRMLRRWKPAPAPAWVTCIPSRRLPGLVPDFAGRLANALGLPFHEILGQTRDRQEQKSMRNIEHKARNLYRSLAIRGKPLPGPVLLVDDVVGSGLTFALAAWILRSSGSGEVLPLALSSLRGP